MPTKDIANQKLQSNFTIYLCSINNIDDCIFSCTNILPSNKTILDKSSNADNIISSLSFKIDNNTQDKNLFQPIVFIKKK